MDSLRNIRDISAAIGPFATFQTRCERVEMGASEWRTARDAQRTRPARTTSAVAVLGEIATGRYQSMRSKQK